MRILLLTFLLSFPVLFAAQENEKIFFGQKKILKTPLENGDILMSNYSYNNIFSIEKYSNGKICDTKFEKKINPIKGNNYKNGTYEPVAQIFNMNNKLFLLWEEWEEKSTTFFGQEMTTDLKLIGEKKMLANYKNDNVRVSISKSKESDNHEFFSINHFTQSNKTKSTLLQFAVIDANLNIINNGTYNLFWYEDNLSNYVEFPECHLTNNGDLFTIDNIYGVGDHKNTFQNLRLHQWVDNTDKSTDLFFTMEARYSTPFLSSNATHLYITGRVESSKLDAWGNYKQNNLGLYSFLYNCKDQKVGDMMFDDLHNVLLKSEGTKGYTEQSSFGNVVKCILKDNNETIIFLENRFRSVEGLQYSYKVTILNKDASDSLLWSQLINKKQCSKFIGYDATCILPEHNGKTILFFNDSKLNYDANGLFIESGIKINEAGFDKKNLVYIMAEIDMKSGELISRKILYNYDNKEFVTRSAFYNDNNPLKITFINTNKYGMKGNFSTLEIKE